MKIVFLKTGRFAIHPARGPIINCKKGNEIGNLPIKQCEVLIKHGWAETSKEEKKREQERLKQERLAREAEEKKRKEEIEKKRKEAEEAEKKRKEAESKKNVK